MAEYTLEELLIARMSREFDGENIGVGATILSDLAARLAKALRVPDLMLVTASRAAADPQVHAKSMADEWILAETARMNLDWTEMFQAIAQGRFQIWIGAVQVDRHGSSNISVIGDWSRPKVQMIGARGVPDDLWGCSRLFYHVRRHTKRSFVEKVDFVCGLGLGEGRAPELGQAARPGPVISDLGVFDFPENSEVMQVQSLHPGVTFEDLQSRTGFAWPDPAGEIPVTEAPTPEELHCIRTVIDPDGMRRLESNDPGGLEAELWQAANQRAAIGEPAGGSDRAP